MSRLVHSEAGRAQLVAAIAAAPAGRLSIPKLRDALVNQADVLDAIRALVDDGTLDRATLRPVPLFQPGAPLVVPDTTPPASDVPSSPAADPSKVSGAELVARFEAALAADPMISRSGFGIALNGSSSGLAQLKHSQNVRAKTVAKFEALLADPPRRTRRPSGDPAPRKPSRPKPRKTGPRKGASDVSGAELVARFDALAAKDPTLSRSAFGRAFNGAGGALKKLAKSKWVAPVTVAKFEALLADPPRRSPLGETRKQRRAERDAPPATRPPVKRAESGSAVVARVPDRDPAIEGQRLAAKVRRSHTETATRILDGIEKGDTTGGAVSPSIAAAMRDIQSKREAEARAADPVEQAKLILRRRGRVAYDATVAGGPKGQFVVSGLPPFVTREQLLAEAEKVSGQKLTGETA